MPAMGPDIYDRIPGIDTIVPAGTYVLVLSNTTVRAAIGCTNRSSPGLNHDQGSTTAVHECTVQSLDKSSKTLLSPTYYFYAIESAFNTMSTSYSYIQIVCK